MWVAIIWRRNQALEIICRLLWWSVQDLAADYMYDGCIILKVFSKVKGKF